MLLQSGFLSYSFTEQWLYLGTLEASDDVLRLQEPAISMPCLLFPLLLLQAPMQPLIVRQAAQDGRQKSRFDSAARSTMSTPATDTHGIAKATQRDSQPSISGAVPASNASKGSQSTDAQAAADASVIALETQKQPAEHKAPQLGSSASTAAVAQPEAMSASEVADMASDAAAALTVVSGPTAKSARSQPPKSGGKGITFMLASNAVPVSLLSGTTTMI